MQETIKKHNTMLFSCHKITMNFMKTVALVGFIKIRNDPEEEKNADSILKDIIAGYQLENNMSC